jgi:hypothetical protein
LVHRGDSTYFSWVFSFLSKALLTAQTTYKAAHFNTTRQNTELKKKVEELEKVKTEANTGLVKVK